MKVKVKVHAVPVPPNDVKDHGFTYVAIIQVHAPKSALAAVQRDFRRSITGDSFVGLADSLRQKLAIEWRGAEIEAALRSGLAAIGETEVPDTYLNEYLEIS